MKKALVILIIFLSYPLWADSIYLNDGTVVKGKVIRITDKYIEYDPEGDRPYDFFPRGQISKIVYDDGREELLSETAGNKNAVKGKSVRGYKGTNLFLEIEWGWNGYVGFGPRIDWRIFDSVSVNAGAGIGLWGERVAGGLRYYMNYPYGLAVGLGAGYNTGGNLDITLRTVDTTTGVEQSETVKLDLKPSAVVNATLLYSWKLGPVGKLYIEAGYGFPVKEYRYRYSTKSSNTLTSDSKDFINTISPGGVILSLGYAFAL